MLVGRLVMFPLTEWFVVRYLRKPYLELRDSVSRYWKVFAAMSALYYVLLVVVANYPVMAIGKNLAQFHKGKFLIPNLKV